MTNIKESNYMTVTVKTVDELIDLCIQWAGERHNGKLTVHSEDGGLIILRSGRNGNRPRFHDHLFYDAIEIERIQFPVLRHRQGLFAELTSSLADLGAYGILFIEHVQDEEFSNALQRNGYIKQEEPVFSSFYSIIGNPLEKDIQQTIKKREQDFLREMSQPKTFRLGITKRM